MVAAEVDTGVQVVIVKSEAPYAACTLGRQWPPASLARQWGAERDDQLGVSVDDDLVVGGVPVD
jgi:hypothetical protein